MLWSLTVAFLLAAPPGADKSASKPELAAPVKVLAAGKPIDVAIGHAAPCLGDLLGEGKPQLLVGQFGEGKLRIYRNVGDKGFRFDSFDWFQAGGGEGKVPAG